MKRSGSFLFLVIMAVIALSGAGLVSVKNSPTAEAASGCGCAGDYVNPAAKSPSVAKPKEGSTSPKGTYTLTVSSASLTVKDAKTNNTLLNLTGLSGDFHAGFSPNDAGFAVWSLNASGGYVALYDLSSKTPSHVVWSNTYLGSFSLGFSPHGKYFLVAAPVNTQFTQVTIVDATSGASAYGDQVAGNTSWGFSPDDQRIAFWTGTNNATIGTSTSTIILYDLSAHKQVWRIDGAYGGVSVAFSPHGVYFASAAISNGSHADLSVVAAAASTAGENTPSYHGSFDLFSPPGKGKDKFDSAAWGFGPSKDDSTFVYDAVDGQSGVDVVMVNLTTSAAHPFAYPNLVSGWWKFSPCDDVLGIIIQPDSTNSVDVGLYNTSSGQTLATDQFSSLNVSLKATESYHVVTVNGTDHNLAKNAGHADCSNSGGSGSGSGSGTGNHTGGSNSGSGSNNGGGSSSVPPCPSCYVPPVVLTDLQVSPIAVVGGSQITGTLTTTTGGAVALSSSDPTIATVPATVNTLSGPTTFSIATSSVDQDTLITVTAKAGDTTKTAKFVVQAACATSSPAASASVIVTAPIAGNGGGRGGPIGGPIERPTAQVSVNPMVVVGPGTTTGSITLTDPAKVDATFTLTSSDATTASVPTSVTVAQGQKMATFSVSTIDVSADELVTIGAHAPGYLTRSATLAVMQAPALDSLTLNPSSVEGGTSVTGTVTLSGSSVGCQAETVSLTSDNSDVASVPASVTIPAGSNSATFTVQTNPVTFDIDVTIDASLGEVTRSASLTIKAPAPPSSVYNDNIADAATLDIPGGAIGDTGLATMETGEPLLSGTCAVLSGHEMENSVWFKLTPTQSGILTASTANAGTDFDSVLALYADPGSGGVGALGTPVGCDNNADALQSTDSGSSNSTLRSEEHTGPNGDKGTLGGWPTWSSIMHVNVTAGQTYYLQLGGVGGAPSGHYVLTAEINPAILLPNVLASVSIDSPSVVGSSSATGTVTLSEIAPAGGVIVALASSDDTVASVSDYVIVPEGADHATFTIQTNSVSTDTAVTVTASFDGAQRTADMTVSAP